MNKIKGFAALALAGVAVVGLTACQDTPGATNEDASPVALSEDATEAPAEEPAEEAPAQSGPLTLGTVYTWEDGLSATVMSIEPVTLSASYDPKPGFAVVVQFTNGTPGVFDPTMSEIDLTYGAAGVTADETYDGDITGFSGDIAPGGTQTGTLVYENVADPSTFTVSVEPWNSETFDSYDTAFWKK